MATKVILTGPKGIRYAIPEERVGTLTRFFTEALALSLDCIDYLLLFMAGDNPEAQKKYKVAEQMLDELLNKINLEIADNGKPIPKTSEDKTPKGFKPLSSDRQGPW